jgi:TRAP-type C4-dicarboxylate transport system permease small subunit
MIKTYHSAVSGLVRVMYSIAGAAIVAMMLLTCADVVLRFFRRPIPGTYEVVSFLGAVAVSFAIAQTSAEKGHVAVTFAVESLPQRLRGVVRIVVHLLGLGLFAVLAWQSMVYAGDLRLSGELSPTIKIPYYPVVYGIGFASLTVCLVLIIDLWENLRGVFRG